jgi:hypothetical protein
MVTYPTTGSYETCSVVKNIIQMRWPPRHPLTNRLNTYLRNLNFIQGRIISPIYLHNRTTLYPRMGSRGFTIFILRYTLLDTSDSPRLRSGTLLILFGTK